jgi:hypothetical protein
MCKGGCDTRAVAVGALRQPLEERDVITDLAKGYVPLASGRRIPSSQIASASAPWDPGVLWGEGRNDAATVCGMVPRQTGRTNRAHLLRPARIRTSPGCRGGS